MHFERLESSEGTIIDGLCLMIPQKYEDERGFFCESWNKKIFDSTVESKINFVQDNQSKSYYGVLRGIHYQINPMPQSKLIRCIKGEIFDIAVDIRRNSKTFGKWAGTILSKENMKQFWIPNGFAHGFLTLSETAEVLYKTNNYWNQDLERTIKWDDEMLSIKWPIEKLNGISPILSKKDREGSNLKDLITKNEVF